MFGKRKSPNTPHYYFGPAGNLGGEIVPDRFDHEPIVGYRSWKVTPDLSGMALRSLHIPYTWQNPDTARCHYGGRLNSQGPGHDPADAPHPECSCGLYAQHPDHEISEWASVRNGRVTVFGTVELTGRVIVAERGYKAQHARILSGYFELSCVGACMNRVVMVQPRGPDRDVYCYCTAHEPVTEPHPLVDSDTWIRNAITLLERRYGVEFFYFY